MRVHNYKELPAIEEIGDKIFKTSISQPFYSDNNIYIIKTEEPAIIDSGFIRNLGILQKTLVHIGLSLKKIKHIFYTHNHLDHISAALTLKHYTNAKLYGMNGMSKFVGDYFKYIEMFQRSEIRLIYKSIPDQMIRNKYVKFLKHEWDKIWEAYQHTNRVDPILKMDIELVEGDVIDIAGKLIGFLHTPGHNNWHLTPYILGEGIYFTGDLVLQNISSIYAEVDGNLSDYHKSLERLQNIPIKRILPAHGDEPKNPGRSLKALSKTLTLMERGVARRLKTGIYDLNELAMESMGEKIKDSPYYIVALAIMHSIILKFISRKEVKIHEIEPPYEKYEWIGME